MPLAVRLHALSALLWLAISSVTIAHHGFAPAAWSPRVSLGIGALLAFAPIYGALVFAATHRASQGMRALLIGLQATCVLFAFDRLHQDPLPGLLAVVAAQLAYHYTERTTWLASVGLSAVLGFILASFTSLFVALIDGFLYFALQAFSIFLIYSNRQAEDTRDALVRTNTELLSMQALLEETVRDRERLRIARDLHDVMGHKLTALRINVQIMQRNLAEAPSALERVALISEELLHDTRVLVRQMGHTAGLAIESSLVALRQLLPGSAIEVAVDRNLRVQHGDVARLLLRAAQEGVSNALRHGRATAIQVQLTHVDEQLVLRVTDNGIGVAQVPPGFGLTQLDQQVRQLGGQWSLKKTSAGGAELWVSLPDEGAGA